MILAILLKTIIFLEHTVVTYTSLIELKGHQHMGKKGNHESNCKCILSFLFSLLKRYCNHTLLSLITVSYLLSRVELLLLLLLLLVHQDLATSSFTFTHLLWPLPDNEISNTFFLFLFFWSNSLCKYFSCQKHRMCLFLLSKFK